ncbi:MAG: C45 family peptidase [Candidatus Thorarchaeota archaeon]
MVVEFPIYEIGGSASERGLQYGQLCKSLIHNRLDLIRSLFDSGGYFDFEWNDALKNSKKFLPFIEEYDPELVEEMNSVAEGAELKPDEILFLNVSYEYFSRLVHGVWDRCTTIAVTPSATTEGVTFIAQNDDWNEVFQQFMILLHIKQDSKPDIFQHCDAGTLGGNGINSAGVALCANSLLSGGWTFKGIPHLFVKRKILNSENMVDAVSAITSIKRCSSHNYLLAHSDGEGIDVESAPQECNFIFPEDGFITHTNHFVSNNPRIYDYKVQRSPDTLLRKHRADTILKEETGNITTDTIKRVFTDHFSRPHSICRHPNKRLSPMKQMQTNASLIFNMTQRTLEITRGTPCENEYITYEV